MSRFSTANLNNKFTFGNKHNNPVNNVLLWRSTINQENKLRKISNSDAQNPHIEVNPYRGLISRAQTPKQHPEVATRLQNLDLLLKKQSQKSTELDKKLDRILGRSQKVYADLIEEHERPRKQDKPRRKRRLRLPKTKRPPPLPTGSGQVSFKNRQVMSHNLMNYAF